MNTFAATQVRLHAQMMRDEAEDAINDYRLIHREQLEREYLQTAAMLDAFAQRLEEEQNGRIMLAPEGFREQGRREVYAEIASLSPTGSDKPYDSCKFCGQDVEGDQQHDSACLWLRAQQVTP